MSAIFWTIVGLRVLVVVARPNCRIAECNEVISSVNTENEVIKQPMWRIQHPRSQRIRGFVKHRTLVYPRQGLKSLKHELTSLKKKHPIRIKISRKYLKKHLKYPKAKFVVSRNLQEALNLKKHRRRRHMNFIKK